MGGSALVWAGVPHNSDGVVFQMRVGRGLQRFHVPRTVLEKSFDLGQLASDTQQLECFYEHLESILDTARKTRANAKADTVPLGISDFARTVKTGIRQNARAATRRVP